MEKLPDPRRYMAFSENPLVVLASRQPAAGIAAQQEICPTALRDAMAAALRAGDDGLIEQALAEAPSQAVRRALAAALGEAGRPPADAGLHWHVFALPVLLVCGGRAGATVPGVVPDIDALRAVFDAHGALGPLKNFALGNAFVSAAGLRPLLLWRQAHDAGSSPFRPLALAPEPVAIADERETVHLRFLAGVSVGSAGAPAFAETAGNIAAWGMPFTRELAAQLSQPGLSLLPIPRPPMSPRQALEAGAFAQAELGLQLFLSRALRDFRSRVGDPAVHVAACADATVRIALSTPFDAGPSAEYRWPLGPADDLAAVSRSILDLLQECRLEQVEVLPEVQPAASH
ncbi:MAG TPA: hypothetical protein VFV71_10095 [Burkholderiales bacterium]|nr:hypothetical protein [Burkholderiales bacterium]